MNIRRIRTGEFQLFKQMRLTALKSDPEAFGSTYEGSLSRTDESWAAQADSTAEGSDRATYFAEEEGKVYGMAALYRTEEGSTSIELIQMWVSADHRGTGLADMILRELFAWAAGNDYVTIKAEVKADNAPARRFYEKVGFMEVSSDDESVFLEKPIKS